MDLENGLYQECAKKESWKAVLTLAYQTLGVVYGDLSTSPLHARISSLPTCQLSDETFPEYKNDIPFLTPETSFGPMLKTTLEKYSLLHKILLVFALIGSCMALGEGVLTPAISVFSAVSGLELSLSKEHHKYVEVPVACLILIALFALQHYGTHRVGFMFAPIILTWLCCISSIGLYNIFHWNRHVFKALSPHFMFQFLKKTHGAGFMSLGGILLCITGSEAMYTNLGHFSQLSIKIAFALVVYPSLVLAYMGQAVYLSRHHTFEDVSHFGFYVSVPEKLRWPVLVIAILAAVIGSQAIITGTFSIIKQYSALSCSPRVRIIHTNSKIHGQIYIPEIKWLLMVLCLAVTIGFRDTKSLGNASGLAVITAMLVTTCLMSLVIVLSWHCSVFLALSLLLTFGTVEILFFSASLVKFLEGAWVPFAMAFFLLIIMCTWQYGTLKNHKFDTQNKVSIDWIVSLGPNIGIVRVRGIGLIHTELMSGVPVIFSHFVTNLPAFHQVLIFLCIKHVPIAHVKSEERFLVGRAGPRDFRLYRCIVRYGYCDMPKDDVEFEKDIVCSIMEFICTGSNVHTSSNQEHEKQEKMSTVGTYSKNSDSIRMIGPAAENVDSTTTSELNEIKSPANIQSRKRVGFIIPESWKYDISVREELQELMEARESGIAYILLTQLA